MSRNTKESLYLIMIAVAAVALLWFVLSRLHIFVVTFIPWWMLGLLILVPIVVIFLVVDHFIG